MSCLCVPPPPKKKKEVIISLSFPEIFDGDYLGNTKEGLLIGSVHTSLFCQTIPAVLITWKCCDAQ